MSMLVASHKAIYAALIFFATSPLTGCAPDRDVDDWKREKLEEELSKLSVVSGSFQGTIQSKKDGSELGALVVSLEPDTQVAVGTDGWKSEERPVLRGALSLKGPHRFEAVIKKASFDPENGSFKAVIPVERKGRATEEIILSGQISAESFTGTLEVFGYPDGGGTFTLLKNIGVEGQPLLSARDTKDETPKQAPLIKEFQGEATLSATQEKMIVGLVLNDTSKSTEERFVDFLMPVSSLQVTLKIHEHFQILFSDAEWDHRVGTLVGSTRIQRNGMNLELILDCKERGQALDCNYHSSLMGLVAQAVMEPRDPGSPAPLFSQARTIERLQYEEFHREPVSDWKGKMQLAIRRTLSSEDRFLDLLVPTSRVEMSLNIPGVESYLFPNSELDRKRGTLEGVSASRSGSGLQYEVTLSCKELPLPSGLKGWECRYYSSLMNVWITLQFAPVKTSGDKTS